MGRRVTVMMAMGGRRDEIVLVGKCTECVYYQRIDAGTGYCRESSPSRTVEREDGWPVVMHSDWCGDGLLVVK